MSQNLDNAKYYWLVFRRRKDEEFYAFEYFKLQYIPFYWLIERNSPLIWRCKFCGHWQCRFFAISHDESKEHLPF